MDLLIEQGEFSVKKLKYDNFLVFGIVFISLLIVFAFGIGNVSAVPANTIYVNGSGGNDLSDGSSWLLAKKTINNGIETLSSGGTLNIANGRYSGTKNTNITIDKNMNIKGQSKTSTIISGTGVNWIFYINDGIKVNIANLTLFNATSSYSGAVDNYGSLYVSDCILSYNKATNPGCAGGAILNSGNLTVKGSTFTGNYANGVGGAIFNQGKLAVTESTFNHNSALTGGAIFNDNDRSMTVTNSKYIFNSAHGGGAIYNGIDSTLSAMRNTFVGNNASYGGLMMSYGTVDLNFNRIFGNNASEGKTLYNVGIMNASLNWWGSNTGPSKNDINTYGNLKLLPWLVLTITSNPSTISQGGYSTITASLRRDNNGILHTEGFVPNGIPVHFYTTLGSIAAAPYFLTNGITKTTLQAGTIGGLAKITTTVDYQSTQAQTRILDTIPPKVSSTTPTDLETGFSRTSTITIKFNENIISSTNFKNVVIKNLSTNKFVTITKTVIGNTIVLKMAKLRYAYNWYSVTIPSSAIKDIAGNNLVATYTFKFKTKL